jgi:hypothetical protein
MRENTTPIRSCLSTRKTRVFTGLSDATFMKQTASFTR